MTMLRSQANLVVLAGAICANALTLLLLAELSMIPMSDAAPDVWAVRRASMLVYIPAIGLLAMAGRQIANGHGFGNVMPGILRWSGSLLVAGAAYDTFGSALILRTFAIGEFRSYAFFDPTYVTLGAVGLLLWLFGGLMKRAVAMARELEEFL